MDFCQAAVWLDIARNQPEYHRGRWHYINLPEFLNASQAAALGNDLTVNINFDLPDQPDAEPKDYNAVQAVKHSLNVLASDPDQGNRAVHYCWLLHVIPDLAQPIHSSALFTERLLPGGDRGGRLIRIMRQGASGQGRKLHGIWDGLLGASANFNTVQSRAVEIIDRHGALFNAPVIAVPDDLWATEYLQVALQSAYGPLLFELRDQEEGGGPHRTILVPGSYFTEAGEIASRQAAIAGSRLAAVLASTLEPDGPMPFALSVPGLEVPAAVPGVDNTAVAETPSPFLPRADLDTSIEARLQRLEEEIAAIREQLVNGRGRSIGGPSSLVLGVTPAQTAEDYEAEEVDGDDEECSCGAD